MAWRIRATSRLVTTNGSLGTRHPLGASAERNASRQDLTRTDFDVLCVTKPRLKPDERPSRERRRNGDVHLDSDGRRARRGRERREDWVRSLDELQGADPEQACALATFLDLPELDADFLLALVERNRAGNSELRAAMDRRLGSLRERRQQLEHRMPGGRTLSREQRATFYSQWYYSAVRLCTSLPEMKSAESIAERLDLPRDLVRAALGFLLEAGLLVEDGNGFRLAPKRTHLGASSPLAPTHHRNWRVHAMNRYERMTPRDFAFTSPVTLSRADFFAIRELLVDTVTRVSSIVEPSDCESLALLNIDWLEL